MQARWDKDPEGAATLALRDIASAHALQDEFSEEVHLEVKALLRAPGIDDPALVDLTALPFVTIDNDDSKDLDQALHIQRRPKGGYEVFYALADAAYYVRPGTALCDEAMRRGTSYYLPGFNVPMLPRALSEGLVSLNEGVARRSLVFRMTLDADGHCEATQVLRARIQSQRQLSYRGVQAYYDNPQDSGLRGQPFTEGLELLREVGKLRMRRAEKHVVRFDRVELHTSVGPKGLHLAAAPKLDVEQWNAEVSLLCNSEGAKKLGARGLYKVHPPPREEDLQRLDRLIDRCIKGLGLDGTWDWRRDPPQSESLREYIARLPRAGPGQRLAMAIQRQALLLGRAATFSCQPGEHHGIGAHPYSRFSSPMREAIGILTHHLLLDPGSEALTDADLQRAVESANRAGALQKTIDREVTRLALDQLLSRDLFLPFDRRPPRRGTVMGFDKGKAYVQLDDPAIEVKLYASQLRQSGGTWVEDALGTTVRCKSIGGLADLAMGGPVALRVAGFDLKANRWSLVPVRDSP